MHSSLLRAGLGREDPVALVVRLQRVDVDDVGRPLGGLADLRLPRRDLLLPRMPALAGLHPAATEPGHACARQRRVPVVAAAAEDQDIAAVGARAKRVGLAPRPVDDAGALPHLVNLTVLPRETGAAGHVGG